jgi:uptake hydrogenase small subunit
LAINVYWLQCGGCGGDSMSMLNAESPDIIEAIEGLGVNMLWHPSLSTAAPVEHRRILSGLIDGGTTLDILCIEGAVIRGPDNTGMFETFDGRPKKDLIRQLADRAGIVVAIGTCACFGGVTGAGETDAVGLQFSKRTRGGFLGDDFKSGNGLPVINLPGCPVHPTVIIGAITALAIGMEVELNTFNAPLEYYSMLVHQGCTRNEYHEYRIEETDFGQKGCLFFHLGCQGPLAHGPCNKFLWNKRSCKTRSGVPCFGCTEPDFPQENPFFDTPNIVGLPIHLPDGVNRPHYLAYKGMAAAAAPERLKHRKTEV